MIRENCLQDQAAEAIIDPVDEVPTKQTLSDAANRLHRVCFLFAEMQYLQAFEGALRAFGELWGGA